MTREPRGGYGFPVRGIEMEELISPKELCKLLKVSPTWPYKMIQRGRLPYYKIEGVVRFRRSDIETFLEESRMEAKGTKVGKKEIESPKPK